MEGEVDEKELKAAGAEKLPDGRRGVRIHGWEIDSSNRSILTSLQLQQWEQKLQTSHLPEMIFGDSSLILKHSDSGTKIHFNAFDALVGWKQEALPPVEVPAAAKWKFRSKPFQQVILDYDYTFTTPYSGSGTVEINSEHGRGAISGEGSCNLHWEDCEEQIDVVALASKEPILFYDELRVDGMLMRLRDTRMHCVFGCSTKPVITRESCWREATFQALSSVSSPFFSVSTRSPDSIGRSANWRRGAAIAGLVPLAAELEKRSRRAALQQDSSRRSAQMGLGRCDSGESATGGDGLCDGEKGYPADSAAYNDPSAISQRLPIVLHKTQKLIVPNKM
ncbi:hypothetical protein RJ639_025739 [Escallonia herrerae]|uniref:TIP41-like protein n=1 Tax=Escallonia herrerae TaxID=1293975 RepID=A0AA88UX56_9ASTE|nr:hypothetical protein RJ639_025739 [Escallonia herrerae]